MPVNKEFYSYSITFFFYKLKYGLSFTLPPRSDFALIFHLWRGKQPTAT